MYPQETTHQLLLTLLFSETGLYGTRPLHSEAQLNMVVEAFPVIQRNLCRPHWIAEHRLPWPCLSGLSVTQEADAQLFCKLYDGMAQHQKDGLSADSILSLVVDPAICAMVQKFPSLEGVLKLEFATHLASHNVQVSARVLRSLDTLRLGFLAPVHLEY
ncbi:MAG: hypothetical protein Q7S87_03445 [Agitococcus sp.]|nr:hypothetical protein [Agitococcus sp.]MDO9178691.1 hypothetical protein [Agitococcus sp.]